MEENKKDSPRKVIDDYLAALREAKGEAAVATTGIRYEKGWFLISGNENETKRLRKQQIVSLTKTLLENPIQTRIIADYLDALRSVKGDSYANETMVEYLNGWFVVDHVNGKTKRYRKKEILQITESLKAEPFDGSAYDRAKNERREAEEDQFRLLTQKQQSWSAQYQQPQTQVSDFRRFAIFAGIIIAIICLSSWYANYAEKRDLEVALIQRAENERQLARQKEENEKREAIEATRRTSSYSTSQSRNADNGFVSARGRINVGAALYHKNTRQPFGFIVDIEDGYVWVADSYRVRSSSVRLYATRYSRDYITSNFDTK